MVRVLIVQATGSEFKSPAPLYKAGCGLVGNPNTSGRGDRMIPVIPGASYQPSFGFRERPCLKESYSRAFSILP